MPRGQKPSLETRKKMSDAKKRNPTRYWAGKRLSPETVERLRIAHKGQKPWNTGKKRPEISGQNSPNWKGGITPLNSKIRHSLEYKLWRSSVFERDNYTCVWCGARSERGSVVMLNADHIKPFALFPELRFAIDNGRTLCVPCHETTDTYKGKTK